MADKNDHITNPSFKISTSSVVESDRVLFNRESIKFLKRVTFLIVGDFILTEYIFVNDYIIISIINDKEINWAIFSICSSISLVFFGVILFLLYLKKPILSKIVRFLYLIIGILFFIFQVIQKMLYLNDKDFSIGITDIILFIVISLTIIPRITGFLYIRLFEKKIEKMKEAELAEEHELLLEKVVDKFDRSTVGNKLLDKEIDKELEKDEEEIIFKIDNKKLSANKIKKRKKENEDKEEVADMD
jgi:hypothetical protein